MGPLMYIFFGTVREISVGPNSVLALMINSYVSEGGVAYAVILAFLTGIIQLIIGLLNLGKTFSDAHFIVALFWLSQLLGAAFTSAFSLFTEKSRFAYLIHQTIHHHVVFVCRFHCRSHIGTCYFGFLLGCRIDGHRNADERIARTEISRLFIPHSLAGRIWKPVRHQLLWRWIRVPHHIFVTHHASKCFGIFSGW